MLQYCHVRSIILIVRQFSDNMLCLISLFGTQIYCQDVQIFTQVAFLFLASFLGNEDKTSILVFLKYDCYLMYRKK